MGNPWIGERTRHNFSSFWYKSLDWLQRVKSTSVTSTTSTTTTTTTARVGQSSRLIYRPKYVTPIVQNASLHRRLQRTASVSRKAHPAPPNLNIGHLTYTITVAWFLCESAHVVCIAALNLISPSVALAFGYVPKTIEISAEW